MAAIHGVILGAGGNPYIDAIGGDITDETIATLKWRIHRFVKTGEFEVLRTGTVFNDLEYLVQGGGGGGGAQNFKPAAGSGGGGGGAVPKTGTASAMVKKYPAVVGVGGEPSKNGKESSFNALKSKGGGGGGAYGAPAGLEGGCGGGAGQPFRGEAAVGGATTDGGFKGGDVTIPSPKETGGGGGGGGAKEAGFNAYGAISPFNGGNGGDGVTVSISGADEELGAGGGGAGCNASSESGTGTGEVGVGGSASTGGDGAKHSVRDATEPKENTGSGGGGGNGVDWKATNGADGVIYVRYRIG